jgi:hypothetical protein
MATYKKYLKIHTFKNQDYYSVDDVQRLLQDIRTRINCSKDIYKMPQGQWMESPGALKRLSATHRAKLINVKPVDIFDNFLVQNKDVLNEPTEGSDLFNF